MRIKSAITTAADESEHAEVRELAADVIASIDKGAPIAPNVARIAEKRHSALILGGLIPLAPIQPKRIRLVIILKYDVA